MDMDRLAFSVPEFCEKFDIGKSTFYKLRKVAGSTPDVIKVGKRTLITVEAINRWLRQNEEQNNG